jgi:hypothetical protein
MNHAKKRSTRAWKHATTKALAAMAVTATLVMTSNGAWAESCEDKLDKCLGKCGEERDTCAAPYEQWKRNLEEQCDQLQKDCNNECNGSDDVDRCRRDHCEPARNSCQEDVENWYRWHVAECDQQQWRCGDNCYEEYSTCS